MNGKSTLIKVTARDCMSSSEMDSSELREHMLFASPIDDNEEKLNQH